MATMTKLTPKELMAKARKTYEWRVGRAHYHNDLIEACLKYMSELVKIIEHKS